MIPPGFEDRDALSLLLVAVVVAVGYSLPIPQEVEVALVAFVVWSLGRWAGSSR